MRIGISTRGLNKGSYAISSIVYHLSLTMIELAGDRHEIFLYFNRPESEHLFKAQAEKWNSKLRSAALDNRFLWDQVWLPHAIKKDNLDIALFMKGTMPALLSCRGAVIFHDLGYFDERLRPYKFFDTVYMKAMMTRSAHKAFHVFADSEYTRLEAIEIMGIPADKVSVCFQNCSPIYRPIDDEALLEAVRTTYGLPGKFMFCPVSLSPRKNVGRILDAFAAIQEKIPHDIIITGGQSWREGEVVRRVAAEFSQRVKILGQVENEHMPVLYNLADFTVYPSLLEGFGLPVLEAFRCGNPVLTSNITSIPEVAGQAAYLVDPFNTEEIAAGMLSLAVDKSLRADLTARGFKQADLFTWERTAKIILDAIEKLPANR